MCITNVTECDNMTDDYKHTLSLNNNCTKNENNIDIIIPTFLLTIPCGLIFLCWMSLMLHTLIQPLIKHLIINTLVRVMNDTLVRLI